MDPLELLSDFYVAWSKFTLRIVLLLIIIASITLSWPFILPILKLIAAAWGCGGAD